MKKISTKSAIGSGLQAHGPPATTMFLSSFLSQLLIGTPESLSILSIFVKLSSYWRVKPIKSKSDTGSPLSSG